MESISDTSSEELASLWTAAQRSVGAYIFSLVRDFHEAEDLLQRVAVVLVRKFPDYDRRIPFVAWAIRVAQYEVVYRQRQRASDPCVFDDELARQIAATHAGQAEEAAPEEWALRECLKGIDGRTRQAIELRYRDDLKPAAVAQQMGMESGAARMLLMRARNALRDCIQRRLASPGGLS